MSRSRFERLEPERQETLLQAAAEEFAERGYEAASVNRIVDRSGMSKGSIYYYFDDKDDLFSTVVERATARVIRLVGGFDVEALTTESFWPTMDEFVRRSAAYLESNAWYLKLARSFYRLRAGKGGAVRTRRVFDVAGQWVRRILVKGQALGVVRSDLPLDFLSELTLAVGEVSDRWLLEHWEDMGEVERERMVTAELGVFRRMLMEDGA